MHLPLTDSSTTHSSIPWGWVSDRFGRRPALLCGIFGTSTAILCFGFSQNYAWAMAARASAGLLSGTYLPTYLPSVHRCCR